MANHKFNTGYCFIYNNQYHIVIDQAIENDGKCSYRVLNKAKGGVHYDIFAEQKIIETLSYKNSFYVKLNAESETIKDTCTCESQILFNFGCKCGFLKRNVNV